MINVLFEKVRNELATASGSAFTNHARTWCLGKAHGKAGKDPRGELVPLNLASNELPGLLLPLDVVAHIILADCI